MSLYPAEIQAALMFDRVNAVNLEAVLTQFMDLEQLQTGTTYNVVEGKKSIFYRIYGSNDVMITLEAMECPPNFSIFANTLQSAYTRMSVPDAEELLVRSKSHVLVGVHHGTIPPSAMGGLTSLLGDALPGHSLAAFQQRMRLCGLLSLVVHDAAGASIVHWTQGNTLMRGEVFEKMALQPAPSPMHIHPMLFQAQPTADRRPQIQLKTHGVEHFLGREILLLPTPMPWVACMEQVFAFVSLAIMEKGYVVADGNVFGPDDYSTATKVRHVEAGQQSEHGTGPLYVLDVVHAEKHGISKPDYVSPAMAINISKPPKDVLESLGSDAEKTIQDWQKQKQVAEAAGNGFMVKADMRPTPPPSPSRPVFGKRSPNAF